MNEIKRTGGVSSGEAGTAAFPSLVANPCCGTTIIHQPTNMDAGLQEGFVNVISRHTTTAVTINEDETRCVHVRGHAPPRSCIAGTQRSRSPPRLLPPDLHCCLPHTLSSPTHPACHAQASGRHKGGELVGAGCLGVGGWGAACNSWPALRLGQWAQGTLDRAVIKCTRSLACCTHTLPPPGASAPPPPSPVLHMPLPAR